MDTLEIIRQIETDPALRAQLRSVLLGDDFVSFPDVVKALERDMERLIKLEERAEARLDALEKGQQELKQGQQELRHEVGVLSTVVGGTVEEDAKDVIRFILEQKGYRILTEPAPIDINGEVDVVATASAPDGEDVSVLIEAKTRLRVDDVRRFAGKFSALGDAAGLTGKRLGYVYGLVVYPGVDDASRKAGLGVISHNGERVAPLS
ncbi:MAG: hypothetical protein ACYDGY_10990 [Acidimicrobiales bacterium]